MQMTHSRPSPRLQHDPSPSLVQTAITVWRKWLARNAGGRHTGRARPAVKVTSDAAVRQGYALGEYRAAADGA